MKCKKCKSIYSSDVFKTCPICELEKSMKSVFNDKNKNDIFVQHIENHLKEKRLKDVISKICGKTVDQIYAEEG